MMFLDNLSKVLLQVINNENLTYEKLAEICDVSTKFISKMIYKAAHPTIKTLEKMCVGLKKTPNELLGMHLPLEEELPYRQSMQIKEVRCYKSMHGNTYFSVCPRCNSTIEREHQNYCDECGQKLEWKNLNNASIIYLNENKSD